MKLFLPLLVAAALAQQNTNERTPVTLEFNPETFLALQAKTRSMELQRGTSYPTAQPTQYPTPQWNSLSADFWTRLLIAPAPHTDEQPQKTR